MAMAAPVFRSARLAAIVQAKDEVVCCKSAVGGKRPRTLEHSVAVPVPAATVDRGWRGATAVLSGLDATQSPADVLRLVCLSMRATRREVYTFGGGQCRLCLADWEPGMDLAVFIGDPVCCRRERHSSQCPMTQIGALCFECAAQCIGGGWKGWTDTGGGDLSNAVVRPRCPYCKLALCENDVIRVSVY